MKNVLNFIIVVIAAAAIIGCSTRDTASGGNALAVKIAMLDSLKNQQSILANEVSALEAELVLLDPSRAIKPKLISIAEITPKDLMHILICRVS